MLKKPETDAVADLLGVANPSKDSALMGGYEGADLFDRTLTQWQPPRQSADMVVLPAKYIAEGRARDLSRNDAYVAAGSEFHRDAVVGSRLRLMSEPVHLRLGQSEAWAEEFAEEVEDKWEVYAESEECFIDAQAKLTFTGMCRLAVITYVTHQEVLATAEWKRSNRRPAKTAIMLIDPDRLATPQEKFYMRMSGKIRGGIERANNGEFTAFHIHEGYPHESLFTGIYDSKRIAARKPWGRRQVIYISEPTRIDQTRGISQLVTALKETKIARRYRDVVLQNAVINATYAATIESELPSEQIYAMMGNGSTTDPTTELVNYVGQYMKAMAGFSSGSKRLQIDGAKIPHLPPGTKLNMQNAGTPGGVGTDFEGSLLRYLAASLGTTYEELTRDLRNTNYSSIKAGMAMTDRTMQARKTMVVDRFANQAYQLWLEEMISSGSLETVTSRMPSIYEGTNLQYYARAEWLGSGRTQIDELKETQAALLRIKGRLSTYKKELARLHGADWRKVFRQIAVEQRMMEDLEIKIEEDAAMNAATGAKGEANETTSQKD
jgi:lambda family phage portal protein